MRMSFGGGADDAALCGQADRRITLSSYDVLCAVQHCEAEVEQLYCLATDHHIRGFEIAVREAAPMSGVERTGDLDGPAQSGRRRNRTPA